MKKQSIADADRAAIGHKAIMASAGSGKTFQLANRYVGLLARGVEPDRICALTFSRKAAGEIFDSIIKTLVDAAAGEKQARTTGVFIGCPGLAAADFRRILREFLSRMQAAHTGTLDSFIIGVIRAFPAELGVPFEFGIMNNEGAEALAMRDAIMRAIFSGAGVARDERAGFLQAFKLAVAGENAKTMRTQLDDFVSSYRRLYQLAPDKKRWGDIKSIWPGGCAWMRGNHDARAAADILRGTIPDVAGDPRARTAFLKIVDGLGEYSLLSRRASIPGGALFAALIPVVMGGGQDGSLTYNRKVYTLDHATMKAFRTLVFNLFKVEYERALARTAGIVAVLELFERHYDRMMRQAGVLTFDDAQYLLTAHNAMSGGALLSRRVGEERRLYIDYRLDSKLDHWLIDEFQDTSDLQWAVLSNLIDEIIQDQSGARSFFCVGDIKQAIYGWRGGNPRLFRRVIAAYTGEMEVEPLSRSFRSCQAIIDTVNATFDNCDEESIPAPARAAWQAIWQPHAIAAGKVPAHGYATLVEATSSGDDAADESVMACIAGIVREIDPIARRISAAILVRRNETGAEIANYLRRNCPGIPVSLENSTVLADNPVVALIMAMAQLATHPGDTLAWRHLQMSPLGGWLADRGWDRARAADELATQIGRDGYRAFTVFWGARLDDAQGLDSFGRQRLSQLAEMAAHFDIEHTCDTALFIERVANTMLDESDETSMVRIMTIHKAKGLGFDAVILPDLDDVRHPMNRGDFSDMVVHRDPATEAIEWLVQPPPKVLAEHDEVFREAIALDDADAAVDALCVLYVAMTRAKRALYMVSGKAPTDALSMATFLKHRLGGARAPGTCGDVAVDVLHEHGQREWYGDCPRVARSEPDGVPRIPPGFAGRAGRRAALVKVEPSRQEQLHRTGGWFFEFEHGDVLEFGIAIHDLFRRVAWVDDIPPADIIRAWEAVSGCDPRVRREVIGQFRAALNAEAVRAALRQPAAPAELWREKSFDVILDDEWVSGVFDRVVIERDDRGRVSRAVVQDFKSNRVTGGTDMARTADNYRPQMALYRRVLARILAVPIGRIDAELIFTAPARVVRLDQTP